MKVEYFPASLTLLMAAISISFGLYCGLEFVVLGSLLAFCSVFLFRINRAARKVTLVISALILAQIIALPILIYGPLRYTSPVAEMFLNGFDEVGFFIESAVAGSMLAAIIISLLMPSVRKRFSGMHHGE